VANVIYIPVVDKRITRKITGTLIGNHMFQDEISRCVKGGFFYFRPNTNCLGSCLLAAPWFTAGLGSHVCLLK